MKFNSANQNIYFLSDPHAFHLNICKGISQWPPSGQSGCRPFNSVEDMNNALVQSINDCVKMNDVLFCLGDWSFGKPQNIFEFRQRLNCKNVHLIFGNHDHHIIRNKPFTTEEGLIIFPQDLFSSVGYYREISIDNQQIILSHYAMRVWNNAHHGAIMLYGHSHGTLPPYYASSPVAGMESDILIYKTMDVGIDTIHPNGIKFQPYSWEEIKEIMSFRVPLTYVDHHNATTN